MPITQDRFVILLSSAELYQRLYKTIQATIVRASTEHANGRLSAELALQTIVEESTFLIDENLVNAASVLAMERTAYKHTHQKNTNRRIRKYELHGVPAQQLSTITPQQYLPPGKGLASTSERLASLARQGFDDEARARIDAEADRALQALSSPPGAPDEELDAPFVPDCQSNIVEGRMMTNAERMDEVRQTPGAMRQTPNTSDGRGVPTTNANHHLLNKDHSNA